MKKSNRRFTCIEGFSGPGGLGLGLHRAGFEILAAFDSDEAAVRTYWRNVSDRAFVADARGLTVNCWSISRGRCWAMSRRKGGGGPGRLSRAGPRRYMSRRNPP